MVRRLGVDVVHLASVPDSALFPAKVAGAPCVGVTGPVDTLCAVTLPRNVVKMDNDQKVSCPRCKRMVLMLAANQ